MIPSLSDDQTAAALTAMWVATGIRAVVTGDVASFVIASLLGAAVPVAEVPESMRRVIDGRPDTLRASVDVSLKRLRTDHIDLYQLHRIDSHVPLADQLGVFADLVQEGKVRHVGDAYAAVIADTYAQAKDAALAMRAAQQKVAGLEGNVANQGGEPSAKQAKELERARAAAGGKDVRVGGGVNTIQQYLRLGLIDEMHIAISPVLLGAGERLFEGLHLPSLGYACTQHVATPLATHIVLSRQ